VRGAPAEAEFQRQPKAQLRKDQLRGDGSGGDERVAVAAAMAAARRFWTDGRGKRPEIYAGMVSAFENCRIGLGWPSWAHVRR